MKRRSAITVLASLVIATGSAAWLLNYREVHSWLLEVRKPAPVYEADVYPYGSQSPPNRILGYIQPGEIPDVISVTYGKEWPYWKVRLASGQRGYLFAPDVEFKRRS